MSRNQSGPPRWVAAVVAASGALVLALTLSFARLSAVQSAGDCWSDDAVFLFEFARSQEDLRETFGPVNSECRSRNIAGMDAVNTLDVFAYIPAYTAFTCFTALFLAAPRRRLCAVAIAFALIAAVADYIETITLLSMTSNLETVTLSQLLTASTAAWVKFGCLASHGLVLSWVCLVGSPGRKVLGVLLALPMLGFLCTALRFDLYGLMKLGFFAAWTPTLLAGFWDAVQGRAARRALG